MPIVRKIFCQNWLMRSSTVALTTALSNESDTSRIPSTAQRMSASHPPYRRAMTSEATVTA
jgi:hypothetical protein